jgi:serine/threonine protein kinase
MAPEYLYNGEISPQCDIYSLGVLIIEFTTGEKNCSDLDKDKCGRNFIATVSMLLRVIDQESVSVCL